MAHISKAVVCACATAFSVTGTVNAQFPNYHVTEIAIFDIDPDGFPLDLIIPNAEDHGTVGVNNLGEIVYSMDTGDFATADKSAMNFRVFSRRCR